MSEEKRKMTLQGYVAFVRREESNRLSWLNLKQLNEIVRMHGFMALRTKKEIFTYLRPSDLMPPWRSTVQDRGVMPCAELDLNEVRDDVAAIGWQECPITSLAALRSCLPPGTELDSSSAAVHGLSSVPEDAASRDCQTEPESKKRKRRRKTKPPPALTSHCHATPTCSSV
ncbi:uncharacterized protein [Typha angustifolia]|uniref:uncharacterized protein isoform X1 n=1 Tax=Typha angustifolia TaxID=59011 RepID=UPI003C2D4D35